MSKNLSFRAAKLRLLLVGRWLNRTRGVWVRALLIWAIAVTVAWLDSSAKYDLRLQARGKTLGHANRIVLVNLHQEDWSDLSGQERNILRPLKEIAAFTDSFFWNTETWSRLLRTLLAQDPKAVAVTFFFPTGSLGRPPSALERPALYDPRVYWAARLDNDGRAMLPAFTTTYGQNAGLIEFYSDEDHVVRRFSPPLTQVPHLVARLAEAGAEGTLHPTSEWSGESRVINFAGPPGTYPVVRARDVLTHPEQFRDLFKDRLVVIGTSDLDGHTYNTPVGPMSRAELIANAADNSIANSWIKRTPFWITALILAAVLLTAVLILKTYTQGVALVFLVWLGIALSAGSIWIFDQFNTWTPLLPLLLELLIAYVLFVAYQLTVQENLNWRLGQEQRYFQEVEQLKHNFVSLFSHDLKTPIAKIQAICDRLLTANPPQEIQTGLQALRRESSELHRYIQSILRVSRIESSDFRIHKEPTDINELVFKVVQKLKPIADAKQVRLETNLEPIFAIDADSELIQEVILNLVENAIKYSPEGSPVSITCREVRDEVIISVTNGGPVIPAEEQARIFEKFYRSPDHSLSTKGSGLGLYLVKYFVELHGGRVFVRSEPSRGTRIGFILPLNSAESNQTEKVYDQRIASIDR